MIRTTILYLHRQTHPRTSRRVYWLRRVGRVVKRVERAASGRSPWWEAFNPHGAGPQDCTVSLFFLSTSLFLPLSLLSCSLSRSIVRIVGYNIQFIMYLWYMRIVALEKWEARIHDSHRLPALLPGKIEWRKIWSTSEKEKKKGAKERRDMVVEEVRGSDGGDRTESAAFRSRVNCRDIVDRAARPSIKRLGQNVLLFGARPADERKKERSRLNEPTWRADHYVKDEGMRKKHDGDNDDDDASRDQTGCNRANSCSLVFSLIVGEQVSKTDRNFERL